MKTLKKIRTDSIQKIVQAHYCLCEDSIFNHFRLESAFQTVCLSNSTVSIKAVFCLASNLVEKSNSVKRGKHRCKSQPVMAKKTGKVSKKLQFF